MIKSYTKILGTPVLLDSIRPLTTVKDIVLDPENGKVIAFLVNLNRKEMIVPIDVQVWHEILKIRDPNAVIAVEEVMKVEEVLRSGRYFYKSKVYTKEGEYLGIILDFAVNTKNYELQSVFVAKTVLGLLRFGSRIIQAQDIEEVKPGKVIVKESMRTIKDDQESLQLKDAPVA